MVWRAAVSLDIFLKLKQVSCGLQSLASDTGGRNTQDKANTNLQHITYPVIFIKHHLCFKVVSWKNIQTMVQLWG